MFIVSHNMEGGRVWYMESLTTNNVDVPWYFVDACRFIPKSCLILTQFLPLLYILENKIGLTGKTETEYTYTIDYHRISNKQDSRGVAETWGKSQLPLMTNGNVEQNCQTQMGQVRGDEDGSFRCFRQPKMGRWNVWFCDLGC